MVNHYTVRGMCSLGSIVAGCVYGEPLHCVGYVLSGLYSCRVCLYTVRGMCSLGSIVAGCVYGEPLHCGVCALWAL